MFHKSMDVLINSILKIIVIKLMIEDTVSMFGK